jgi:AcrR family transcriptional regulator
MPKAFLTICSNYCPNPIGAASLGQATLSRAARDGGHIFEHAFYARYNGCLNTGDLRTSTRDQKTMSTRDKYQKKRLEILRSAATAFRRSGYHGASVDSIARELQMAKGNLYYYFKDKEEILFLCHDYSLDLILKVLEEVEASPLPPDESLHRVIVALIHTIIDELQGTTLILDLEALSSKRLQKILAKRNNVERGIRRIIETGIDSGVFRKGDPTLSTFVILGAVNWIPRWFSPKGSAKSDEIGESFANYLVAGLLQTEPKRSSKAPRKVFKQF